MDEDWEANTSWNYKKIGSKTEDALFKFLSSSIKIKVKLNLRGVKELKMEKKSSAIV